MLDIETILLYYAYNKINYIVMTTEFPKVEKGDNVRVFKYDSVNKTGG